jgi:uncharacterized protein YkwD
MTRRWAYLFLLAGMSLLVLLAAGNSRSEHARAAHRLAASNTAYLPLIRAQVSSISDTPLTYVNYYRSLAGLPPVNENTQWSTGAYNHARYMVKNDFIGHSEDPSNPWYTPEGHTAAQNGNVMISSSTSTTDQQAIDLWMEGVFHSIAVIDPRLQSIGYGSYREAIGNYQMGAVLDVLSGRGSIPDTVSFPVMWPASGAIMPAQTASSRMREAPQPLTSCPGYDPPVGLNLILQVDPAAGEASATTSSFIHNGQQLEHCVFDSTSYSNSNQTMQMIGRTILSMRNAIVLIPRAPLVPGETYTASLTANGTVYEWSFSIAE